MKKTLYLLIILAFIIPSFSFASFDVNLKYGAKGDLVTELQEFLIDQGVLNTQATGNFFSLTLKAVKAFQVANSLPATGFFGPMSRAKANELLDVSVADSNTAEVSETGTVTPPVVSPAPAPVVASPTPTTNPEPAPSPSPSPVASSLKRLEVNQDLTRVVKSGEGFAALIRVRVFGNSGSPVKDVQVIFTTPDSSQNKVANGTGDYSRQLGYHYAFTYQPDSAGTHTVTISVPSLGLSQSVDVVAQEFNGTTNIRKGTSSTPQDHAVPLNSGTPIVGVQIENFDQRRTLQEIQYEVVSDTLTKEDLSLGLSSWTGNRSSLHDLQMPLDLNRIRELTIKLNADTNNQSLTSKGKTGTFKIRVTGLVWDDGNVQAIDPVIESNQVTILPAMFN